MSSDGVEELRPSSELAWLSESAKVLLSETQYEEEYTLTDAWKAFVSTQRGYTEDPLRTQRHWKHDRTTKPAAVHRKSTRRSSLPDMRGTRRSFHPSLRNEAVCPAELNHRSPTNHEFFVSKTPAAALPPTPALQSSRSCGSQPLQISSAYIRSTPTSQSGSTKSAGCSGSDPHHPQLTSSVPSRAVSRATCISPNSPSAAMLSSVTPSKAVEPYTPSPSCNSAIHDDISLPNSASSSSSLSTLVNPSPVKGPSEPTTTVGPASSASLRLQTSQIKPQILDNIAPSVPVSPVPPLTPHLECISPHKATGTTDLASSRTSLTSSTLESSRFSHDCTSFLAAHSASVNPAQSLHTAPSNFNSSTIACASSSTLSSSRIPKPALRTAPAYNGSLRPSPPLTPGFQSHRRQSSAAKKPPKPVPARRSSSTRSTPPLRRHRPPRPTHKPPQRATTPPRSHNFQVSYVQYPSSSPPSTLTLEAQPSSTGNPYLPLFPEPCDRVNGPWLTTHIESPFDTHPDHSPRVEHSLDAFENPHPSPMLAASFMQCEMGSMSSLDNSFLDAGCRANLPLENLGSSMHPLQQVRSPEEPFVPTQSILSTCSPASTFHVAPGQTQSLLSSASGTISNLLKQQRPRVTPPVDTPASPSCAETLQVASEPGFPAESNLSRVKALQDEIQELRGRNRLLESQVSLADKVMARRSSRLADMFLCCITASHDTEPR